MRFTVGYCLYPHGENNSIETRMRLIFDDGLPATELNRHLVMAQLNRDKPLGTTVYQLCIYLNYLDMRGLEAVNATMDNLYNFLCELYIDGLPYGCNKAPKSYNNICDYVDVIISVQDVLKANDRTKLESIVEHIGSITVISIMQICYPSLAIDYFVNVCDCIVRRREPIYPQSVLRHYFKQAPYRGPARAFFYEILSILEGKTPYWYNKLVEGNQQEILSSKSSWILFYFINISSLAYYKISFIGAETLQTEIRYYLYNRSTISGKNIDTHFIYLAAYNINIALTVNAHRNLKGASIVTYLSQTPSIGSTLPPP